MSRSQDKTVGTHPRDCRRKHAPVAIIVPKGEQRAQPRRLRALDAYVASLARMGATEFNYADRCRGTRREPFFDLETQRLLIHVFHDPLQHPGSFFAASIGPTNVMA